jgi:hypothetical protein
MMMRFAAGIAMAMTGLVGGTVAMAHGDDPRPVYVDRHVGVYYDQHHGDYSDVHRGLFEEDHGFYGDLHYGTYVEQHHGDYVTPHTYTYREVHPAPRAFYTSPDHHGRHR